jgi:hypothetical protein
MRSFHGLNVTFDDSRPNRFVTKVFECRQEVGFFMLHVTDDHILEHIVRIDEGFKGIGLGTFLAEVTLETISKDHACHPIHFETTKFEFVENPEFWDQYKFFLANFRYRYGSWIPREVDFRRKRAPHREFNKPIKEILEQCYSMKVVRSYGFKRLSRVIGSSDRIVFYVDR